MIMCKEPGNAFISKVVMRKLFLAFIVSASLFTPLAAPAAERDGVVDITNQTRDAYLSVKISYGNRNILDSNWCVGPAGHANHNFRAHIIRVHARVMKYSGCSVAKDYAAWDFRPRNRARFAAVLTGSFANPQLKEI